MVGDCFLSTVDLFFVQMVKILYFHHNGCLGDCFLSSVDLFFVQTVEILYFHHIGW